MSRLSRSPLHPRRCRLRAGSYLCARPACEGCDPDYRRADKSCRARRRDRLYARRSHARAAWAFWKVALRVAAICRGRRLIEESLMEHEVLRKLRAAAAKAGHDALVAFSQDNV